MNRSSAVTRAALALSMGLLAAGAASAQTMVNARVLSSTPVWEQVPVSDCRGAYPGAVRPSGPGTAVGWCQRPADVVLQAPCAVSVDLIAVSGGYRADVGRTDENAEGCDCEPPTA